VQLTKLYSSSAKIIGKYFQEATTKMVFLKLQRLQNTTIKIRDRIRLDLMLPLNYNRLRKTEAANNNLWKFRIGKILSGSGQSNIKIHACF